MLILTHTYTCIRAYFSIRCNEVKGSDVKMKLATLGEFPDAGSETDQLFPCHIRSTTHEQLTVNIQNEDNLNHYVIIIT